MISGEWMNPSIKNLFAFRQMMNVIKAIVVLLISLISALTSLVRLHWNSAVAWLFVHQVCDHDNIIIIVLIFVISFKNNDNEYREIMIMITYLK